MSFSQLINTIDWDKLRVFYYVAQIGSFTGASVYLNLSQSALSRAIQLLEERLGAKLFIRTTKKLILTEQGRLLFHSAKQVFQEIESSLNQMSETQLQPSGPLRVRAVSGTLSFFLLKYFGEFALKYPNIHLSIIADDAMPEFDLIETDVAIRPPIYGREDLVQRHILTNHIALFASKAYLEEFGVPQKPEDLDHHRLVGFGNHPGAYVFQNLNWHLVAGAPPGVVRAPFLQINTPLARLEMAAMNVGIIAVSREHPGIEKYDLVQVLPDLPVPTIETCYIYPTRLEGSKRVQILGDFLVERCERDYGPTKTMDQWGR